MQIKIPQDVWDKLSDKTKKELEKVASESHYIKFEEMHQYRSNQIKRENLMFRQHSYVGERMSDPLYAKEKVLESSKSVIKLEVQQTIDNSPTFDKEQRLLAQLMRAENEAAELTTVKSSIANLKKVIGDV